MAASIDETAGRACLSAEDLAAFASGVLSQADVDRLRRHVRSCGDCYALAVRVLADSSSSSSSGSSDGARATPPPLGQLAAVSPFTATTPGTALALLLEEPASSLP